MGSFPVDGEDEDEGEEADAPAADAPAEEVVTA